jgi:hypothetical protein
MIKILFLAANPNGTPLLALDKEIRAIDAKIQSGEYRRHLKLIQHWAVRLDDLSGFLMRERPDVVHFSGHGSKSGQIVLLDEVDKPKPVPPQALAERFRVLRDDVRIVVLNACYAEPQAKGFAKVIDCTIGMSDEIYDKHAIEFAAAFYEALAYGRPVQDAFDLGVARLLDEGVAKGLARLHKRRGVNPANITLIKKKPKSDERPKGSLPSPASPHAVSGARKKVVLMDSTLPDLVFDDKTQASGRTNADDITDILSDLNIDIVKENTSINWRREEQVRRMDPDLIIIHFSCFYPTTDNRDAAKKFRSFLEYMWDSRARFLVYTRAEANAVGNVSIRGCKLSSTITSCEKHLTSYWQDRIVAIGIAGGVVASFQDSETRNRLKLLVKSILKLEAT